MNTIIAGRNFYRAAAIAVVLAGSSLSVLAQDQKAAAGASATEASATETAAPEPLSDDELEVLVARIALYPDQLIAVIFKVLAVSAPDCGGFALPGQEGKGRQPAAQG